MDLESQGVQGMESSDDFLDSTVAADEYVLTVTRALLARGFNPHNTLTCVSVCRDEYMRRFVSLIEARWGPAFQLGGVAGAVFVGEGGWSAAMTHAPSIDTKRRMATWVLPHLGRVAGRPAGITLRPGVVDPVPTCGTLALLQARHVPEAEHPGGGGGLLVAADVADQQSVLPADIEVVALVQRLRMAGPLPASIEALTMRVHDCAVEDAVALLRLSAGRGFETAISSGIVVHEDAGDRVWLGMVAEAVPAATAQVDEGGGSSVEQSSEPAALPASSDPAALSASSDPVTLPASSEPTALPASSEPTTAAGRP